MVISGDQFAIETLFCICIIFSSYGFNQLIIQIAMIHELILTLSDIGQVFQSW